VSVVNSIVSDSFDGVPLVYEERAEPETTFK
jgi:hypothetical protein